ncbi:MAG: hypothetical protein WA104_01415 [Thermodesulfovibrionales bacterium]
MNRIELIDQYNLMVSALSIMPWDLFGIADKKSYMESVFRSKEELSKFIELHETLTTNRASMPQPYPERVYEYARTLQGLYGNFELTSEVLAEIQVIIDLTDYRSSWDKSFKYPEKNSPLLRDCPDLLDYLDKRYKIFDMKYIKVLGDFEFGYNNFTFNIHPFVPYEFNRKIHTILHMHENDLKHCFQVAFQTGMYVPRSHYSALFYKDYYRGPKFRENILANKDGVTEHWRHTDGDSLKGKYINAFFKKHLRRTEFMWTTADTTKDFVIEELVAPEATEAIDGENCICVKYIHTQFSPASGNCIHFDGCMNIYDFQSYQDRLETNINRRSGVKAKKHMKLFRVDGENVITNDEWILLTGAFFKDNELVQEYFGSELPWDHQ